MEKVKELEASILLLANTDEDTLTFVENKIAFIEEEFNYDRFCALKILRDELLGK